MRRYQIEITELKTELKNTTEGFTSKLGERAVETHPDRAAK